MSSIRAPLLLLDVDGVLNAMRWEVPLGWRQGVVNGYSISWDPTITARLWSLHQSGRVEIQWLTTWAENADLLLAEPLGLPRGLRERSGGRAEPTGFKGRLGGLSGWWKLAVAREIADEDPGRRIVWIDDDLADSAADTAEWLAAHPHVLVIAPDLSTGLTHEQLDTVEAWL